MGVLVCAIQLSLLSNGREGKNTRTRWWWTVALRCVVCCVPSSAVYASSDDTRNRCSYNASDYYFLKRVGYRSYLQICSACDIAELRALALAKLDRFFTD